MRRRDFISLLSGTVVVWPLVGRAQQPTMPVIGFLNSGSLGAYQHLVAGFRQGLKETGYVEGQNVAIEYGGRRVSMIDYRGWRLIWSVVE
jgi:hypothetical protein